MTVLTAAQSPLHAAFDALLLDLDGVLYLGDQPVEHAADSLAAARRAGARAAFVTNNASRTPEQVAHRLHGFGVPADAGEVVTSSMAVASLLRERFRGAAARVLVCGGEGLQVAVREAGFTLVDSADDDPEAVAQGFGADLRYAELAEAALAVRRGAWWVAANADLTLPTPRGLMPGAGSLLALVSAATGRVPVVAGKPERALHAEAVRRSGAERPLIVGDRLDTDIAGAVRAGTPSLLVLTGVTDVAALLTAGPGERPTYLGADLRALLGAHPPAAAGRCGDWVARTDGAELRLARDRSGPGQQAERPDDAAATDRTATDRTPTDGAADDGLDPVRALVTAGWDAADRGRQVDVDQAAAQLADAGVSLRPAPAAG